MNLTRRWCSPYVQTTSILVRGLLPLETADSAMASGVQTTSILVRRLLLTFALTEFAVVDHRDVQTTSILFCGLLGVQPVGHAFPPRTRFSAGRRSAPISPEWTRC